MSARGAGASARTGRHEDARAEPDILDDTRRSGNPEHAPTPLPVEPRSRMVALCLVPPAQPPGVRSTSSTFPTSNI